MTRIICLGCLFDYRVAGSAIFRNKQRYPTTLAVASDDADNQRAVLLLLLRKFNWRKILVICDRLTYLPAGIYHVNTCKSTQTLFTANALEYKITYFESANTTFYEPLLKSFETEFRSMSSHGIILLRKH